MDTVLNELKALTVKRLFAGIIALSPCFDFSVFRLSKMFDVSCQMI